MQLSGPLPPPSVLSQYAQIEGACELILSMAAKEQKHRHQLDKGGLELAGLELRQKGETAEGKRALAASGQRTGAMVALLLQAGGLALLGVIAIYAPQLLWVGIVAAVLPAASLAGLVYTFMRGERPSQKSPSPERSQPEQEPEAPQLPDGVGESSSS